MLYLIRHGEAEKEEPKALTARGREETIKVGKALQEKGIKVAQVWHSTKLRAKQTAELLNIGPLIEKQGLAPNDPPSAIIDELNKLGDKDIAIVSHLPFLPKLASLLVTGEEDADFVEFKNSGVVGLENGGGKWKTRR